MFRITLCCLLFIAFTPFMCSAMSDAQRDQIHQQFEKVGTECITEIPITPEDLADMKGSKVPTGPNAPCFIACMFKKVGILDEQGMVVHDTALELAKQVFHDEEEVKAVKEFMQFCGTVNSETVSDGAKGCDRAILAFKCLAENASKFGFQL